MENPVRFERAGTISSMDLSRAIIGCLVPLENVHVVNGSLADIQIFEGENILGRNTIEVADKRVSRKHITLHGFASGPVEVIVEGPNPIIWKSGGKRNIVNIHEKVYIGHGDILELIPGNHSFRYEDFNFEHASLVEEDSCFSSKRRRFAEEDTYPTKKIQQSTDLEASTTILQGKQETVNFSRENSLVHTRCSNSEDSEEKTTRSFASCDVMEGIHHFNVVEDRLPFIFRLMQVQGLQKWANSSCVSIRDVIQGNILVAILSNYMVDIDWLLSACPTLERIPHVLVVHGETHDHLKMQKPANWTLHKPALPISYGTHHSKAMFLIYPKGVRVVIHTANLIHVDWNNKSQGLWMQDFPWKNQNDICRPSPFENDLVDYLSALKWPDFCANLPNFGSVNVNASFFRKFDYHNAVVRLIASVPGYHVGANLKKWGHMKLRTVLENCTFDKEFCGSPLVYQFSSLGSLDEKWLAEFSFSLSSGVSNDKTPLGNGKSLIIWPTVEDVRCSLEGYAAGNCIPSPQKNVEKDFLWKYWARWKAKHVGRCRAMPHIKSYTRYNGQHLAWFLLTSANLSKAAWGSMQKNNSQLMIRSYELGVLFLPSTIAADRVHFSCTEDGTPKQNPLRSTDRRTKMITLCCQENRSRDSAVEFVQLPLPYELPPQPYDSGDVPWSWGRSYLKKDVYGEVWSSNSM